MKHRFSRRKRFILFFIGVFLAGLGVALSTRPGLGTSPISSLPYVVTFITPLTLGMTTVSLNMIFMLMQIAILRSRFQWTSLGQIPTLFAFGFFIDLGCGFPHSTFRKAIRSVSWKNSWDVLCWQPASHSS